MLVSNLVYIGNKLLSVRKRLAMTQAEVAEKAGLSDRTYAEIERGTTNMRVETFLKICAALHITPNEILTEEPTPVEQQQAELFARLETCTSQQRETALRLLSVYLQSLE